MIRYTLKCCDGHSFESWFQSATAFETLQGAGQLSCVHCGSEHVSKSLMSPQVSTTRTSDAGPDVEPVAKTVPAEQTDAPQKTEASHNATALAAMQSHVEQNSDYVGSDFVREARAMNDGETPARSIYGEAKFEDAKALIEEGVPVMALPFVPKRKLN
jgi:hypothetical protein